MLGSNLTGADVRMVAPADDHLQIALRGRREDRERPDFLALKRLRDGDVLAYRDFFERGEVAVVFAQASS